MCFGGGGKVTAPNNSQYSANSAQIGQQAVQSGQQQQQWTQDQLGGTQAQLGTAQSAINPAMQNSFASGAAGQQAYTGSVLPGVQSQMQQAQAWGSPTGVASAQANAAANTQQAYNAARMNNQRQLAAYGVDPSTLRGGFGNLQSNLSQAGAVGNATYGAGQQRQLQGFQMGSQALGQGLQASQLGQGYTGQGGSLAATGVGLGNQTLATGAQAQLAPSQWYNLGLSGNSQAANINTQQFQNQLASAQYNNQANTQAASGIGQGVGMIGGLVADYYSAADGGQIPSRRANRRRYDDGGDVQIPQTQASFLPAKTENVDEGGTPQQVGPTDAEKQQQWQSAMMQGAAKGFAQTYFDDGGSVNVPMISIQPIYPQSVSEGGANRGQQPQPQSKGAGQSMMSGMGMGQSLGGMFGGGGGSDFGAIDAGTAASDYAGGAADAAGMFAADGGGMRKGRKGLPSRTQAQNPAQQPSPGMGTAGPMTFADGGQMRPTQIPNGQRLRVHFAANGGQIHAGKPVHSPQFHGGNTRQGGYVPSSTYGPRHMGIPVPQMPSPDRSANEHAFADGGLPGQTYANNGASYSDGSPPGTFVSQGASDGTGIDDQVPAHVSVGEFVVPADVVHAKGKEFFDKLLQKYHTPAAQQRRQMGIPAPHHGVH